MPETTTNENTYPVTRKGDVRFDPLCRQRGIILAKSQAPPEKSGSQFLLGMRFAAHILLHHTPHCG